MNVRDTDDLAQAVLSKWKSSPTPASSPDLEWPSCMAPSTRPSQRGEFGDRSLRTERQDKE